MAERKAASGTEEEICLNSLGDSPVGAAALVLVFSSYRAMPAEEAGRRRPGQSGGLFSQKR